MPVVREAWGAPDGEGVGGTVGISVFKHQFRELERFGGGEGGWGRRWGRWWGGVGIVVDAGLVGRSVEIAGALTWCTCRESTARILIDAEDFLQH